MSANGGHCSCPVTASSLPAATLDRKRALSFLVNLNVLSFLHIIWTQRGTGEQRCLIIDVAKSATLPALPSPPLFSTPCVSHPSPPLYCFPVTQLTRRTPVSSWPATSSRNACSTVGRARPSVCVPPGTWPPPAAGPARAPAPCGPTTASTTASARSSRDTAPLASTSGTRVTQVWVTRVNAEVNGWMNEWIHK